MYIWQTYGKILGGMPPFKKNNLCKLVMVSNNLGSHGLFRGSCIATLQRQNPNVRKIRFFYALFIISQKIQVCADAGAL